MFHSPPAQIELRIESQHRFRAEPTQIPEEGKASSTRSISVPARCDVESLTDSMRHGSSKPKNPHTDSGRNTDCRRRTRPARTSINNFRPNLWSTSPIRCTATDRASQRIPPDSGRNTDSRRGQDRLPPLQSCSDPNPCGVPHRFGARPGAKAIESLPIQERNTDSRRGQDRLSAVQSVFRPESVWSPSLDSVDDTDRASQRIPPIQGGTQIPEEDRPAPALVNLCSGQIAVGTSPIRCLAGRPSQRVPTPIQGGTQIERRSRLSALSICAQAESV